MGRRDERRVLRSIIRPGGCVRLPVQDGRRAPDASNRVATVPPMRRSLLAAAVAAAAALGTGVFGSVPGDGQAAGAATPRCFGAAARDPLHPCKNQRLRLRVTPTPDEALITPNMACRRDDVTDVVNGCSFGVPADQAAETVAIVGDSHAAHWRAALAVVAQAKRWHVLEISTPHCPLSLALPDSGAATANWCPGWNRRVVQWLGDHPEITTLLVSAHSRAPIVVPAGRTPWQTRVEGYVREWQTLPASVQSIVVLRDDPLDKVSTFDCVRRAIAHHRPAGTACRVARSHALAADAEVAAGKLLPPRKVRVVDLTRIFCDSRYCYPVIGGVLVHKDVDHLGQLFARTLGPFLLRGLDIALAPAP